MQTDSYPETVPQLVEEASIRHGDRIAFRCLGHGMSFKEVDVLSTSFAAWLQGLGLNPGDRVAVQLPNLLQYPVVAYGVLRAGMVLVNINPMYTARELEQQLSDSGARVIVLLAQQAHTLAGVYGWTPIETVVISDIGDCLPAPKRWLVNAAVKYLKKAVTPYKLPRVVGLRTALARGHKMRLQPAAVEPGSLAALQYTGGTTGVAKGAMLTHGNLLSNARQLTDTLGDTFTPDGEVSMAPLPLYHIYAFQMNLLALFNYGATSILIPDARDLAALAREIRDLPVTGMVGVNTLYSALAGHEEFRKLDFSHLRYTSAGGMAITDDTARRWEGLTGVEISEGYGLTETSPIVCANLPGQSHLGTVGKAISETEVKVIDDQGFELPPGKPGELCVKGPQVMSGYWQRPEETENVFTDDGWLRTGDIATIDQEGYVRIVDRLKDMILVSGFNVYPNEVENVLSGHDDIVECAVVGVPDEKSGEVVKAFVVTSNPDLGEQEIRDFCRGALAPYKVPKSVEFRDQLPKSNVGKILRRLLTDESGTTNSN